MAKIITRPSQALNQHPSANGAEWSREEQNRLSQELSAARAKEDLKSEIGVFQVEGGDTLRALQKGLTGTIDGNQAVDYRSNDFGATYRPTRVDDTGKIQIGQYVWVEGQTIIVANELPTGPVVTIDPDPTPPVATATTDPDPTLAVITTTPEATPKDTSEGVVVDETTTPETEPLHPWLGGPTEGEVVREATVERPDDSTVPDRIVETVDAPESPWPTAEAFGAYADEVNTSSEQVLKTGVGIVETLEPKVGAEEAYVEAVTNFVDMLYGLGSFDAGSEKTMEEALAVVRANLEGSLSHLKGAVETWPTYEADKQLFFQQLDENIALTLPYFNFITDYQARTEKYSDVGEAYLKYPLDKGFGRIGTWKVERDMTETPKDFPVFKKLFGFLGEDYDDSQTLKAHVINEPELGLAGFANGDLVVYNQASADETGTLRPDVRTNEMMHYLLNRYFPQLQLEAPALPGYGLLSGRLPIKNNREIDEFLSDVASMNVSPMSIIDILNSGPSVPNYRLSYAFAREQMVNLIQSSGSISAADKPKLVGFIRDDKELELLMLENHETGEMTKLITGLVNENSAVLKQAYLSEGRAVLQALESAFA